MCATNDLIIFLLILRARTSSEFRYLQTSAGRCQVEVFRNIRAKQSPDPIRFRILDPAVVAHGMSLGSATVAVYYLETPM